MEHMIVNDDGMYAYFENLIYRENSFHARGWKQQYDAMPYGLTDHQVKTIHGSKELLYGKRDADRQICLLQTMQKFIHENIGIEGLEELLVNNYGTIENSIFFEHDSTGRPANIREHAKHQMKNAYLASVLLLEFGYLQNMAEAISKELSYTTSYMTAQAREIVKNEMDVRRKLEELSYKIVLLSSLLHDIGYPLEYHLRSAQEISDYPPHLKLFTPTVKAEFSEIKVYLLESQLFRQVSHDKIQKKYQENNHGVLSALSLLMHFYYSGRIYSLSDEKRCIIEMAAIAIYHHTDRFSKAERMVYLQDPISYMVRLCDDLQEWERFKLLISEKHNYLLCNDCAKILLEKNREYTCPSCKRKYYKVTQIDNRKVNYICLCDGLEIIKTGNQVEIKFLFHLMKQMEILLDDYTAVLKSESDIKNIEQMISNQGWDPKLKLKWFVSNNPLYLIGEMIDTSSKKDELDEWLEKQKKTKSGKNVKVFYQDYLLKKDQEIFGGRLEANDLKYKSEVQTFVKKYYGEIYYLYQFLYSD